MNIPYARHSITKSDIQAVGEVLESGFLTNGPFVGKFEEKFSQVVGSSFAMAASSGTAALHLAVTTLGIKPGQTVLMPSLTFAATANVVIYAGGKVEFVDIVPETLLMDVKSVEQKLRDNPKKYAGVIGVDFAGMSLDMKRLADICHQYNIWLIEDAAHALGAVDSNSDQEIRVGSALHADAVAFSFHPAKHITTGEGGMITTRHPQVAEKVKLIRSHAMKKITNSDFPEWHYEISELGFNYRMSDINAGLGLSQLMRLDENIKSRRKIGLRYIEELDATNMLLPSVDHHPSHAYHLFIVQSDKRDQLYAGLKKQGIHCQIHYVPLHLQPYYSKLYGTFSLPHTENYYNSCLSIPMFPTLTTEDQSYVIKHINRLAN